MSVSVMLYLAGKDYQRGGLTSSRDLVWHVALPAGRVEGGSLRIEEQQYEDERNSLRADQNAVHSPWTGTAKTGRS